MTLTVLTSLCLLLNVYWIIFYWRDVSLHLTWILSVIAVLKQQHVTPCGKKFLMSKAWTLFYIGLKVLLHEVSKGLLLSSLFNPVFCMRKCEESLKWRLQSARSVQTSKLFPTAKRCFSKVRPVSSQQERWKYQLTFWLLHSLRLNNSSVQRSAELLKAAVSRTMTHTWSFGFALIAEQTPDLQSAQLWFFWAGYQPRDERSAGLSDDSFQFRENKSEMLQRIRKQRDRGGLPFIYLFLIPYLSFL